MVSDLNNFLSTGFQILPVLQILSLDKGRLTFPS